MGLKNSLKIFASIAVMLLSLFSSAQEDKTSEAVLCIDTNTFFLISGQTQIVTPANISIQSSITGAGKLKIIGDKNTYIDAHDKSIANLCIQKVENSEITIISDIHIKQSLDMESGTITLLDFNIFLDDDASVSTGELAHIQYLGNGNIIHTSIPQLLVNLNTDFQTKQLFLNRIEDKIDIQSIPIIWIENRIKIDSFNAKPPTSPA